MSVLVTIYPSEVSWNSNTWNATSDGPIFASFQHSGDPLEDRTADNEYAPFVAVVNKIARVTVRLREVKQTMALGSSSSMVLTLKSKDATTSTITLPGMVLYDVSGSQDRATPGYVELSFAHESTDGAAVPVS